MTQPNNIPEFPQLWNLGNGINYVQGATLIDYFAIHCPGIDPEADVKSLLLSFPELGSIPSFVDDPVGNSNWWIRADVLYRLRFAETMLKERAKYV